MLFALCFTMFQSIVVSSPCHSLLMDEVAVILYGLDLIA